MHSIAKRLLALSSAAVLTLSALPAVHGWEEPTYEGVARWAEIEVTAMDQLDLIPEELQCANLSEEITRQQMCSIAVNTYEKLTAEEIDLPWFSPFDDTDDIDVEKAYRIGIVKGDGNGLFRPDDALSRLEFFCFLSRYLEASGMALSEDNYSDLTAFSDAASLPGWAVEPAQLTVGLDIVKGSGNSLDWQRTTTAQEALVMFYRAYNASISYDPLSEYENLASWAERSVRRMDQMDLLPETVTDAPMDGTITRADLCRMAMRSYKQLTGLTDEDLGESEDVFLDTDDVDIRNAYALGIISGRGNGIFDPTSPITRQDFFTISYNFLKALDYCYADDIYVDLTDYPDGNEISSYAKRAAQVMIGIGAVQGDENSALNPKKEIVSQEAVTIFHRIYEFYTGWCEDPVEPVPYEGVEVSALALTKLGCPYVSGGHGPRKFDCSGLVYYVYKQFGYDLEPGAKTQWSLLDRSIKRSDLIPGDLVFFSKNGKASGIFHVGIYIGNDQFVHAANTRKDVIVSDMDEEWYANRYLGAKRVL